MSILTRSHKFKLFREYREDGLREYIVENNNFYLLYHSVMQKNQKHKVRCIKKVDGFKIYAEASSGVLKTTYYYILDLDTKEVFYTATDVAIFGSMVNEIVKEIEYLKFDYKKEKEESDFNPLAYL